MRTGVVHRYRVVDVFSQRALEGNPLAVFPEASRLDADTMQRIARELNLAETAFVLPATRRDCAARLRIFTPLKEMLFAGHPTIGAAFVLLEEGAVQARDGELVLEEDVGPVRVRVEDGAPPMLWLETPAVEIGRKYDPQVCASVLGLDPADLRDVPPQWLNAGNPTIFVCLRDKEAVDRACIDLAGMRRLRGADAQLACVLVFTPTETGVYSRMFAPEYGIAEDPATGSSTGPLAVYMMRHQLMRGSDGTRLVSEQGTKMGRRSYLHLHVRGDNGSAGIYVGGHVTPLVEASMRL